MRLHRGAIVLCDRYWDASRAYQGVARNLGIQAIDQVNIWATGGLFPDRVYVFDVDPEIGLSRAKSRGAVDRLEQEAMSFHDKVREAYLFIAESHPATYMRVDASRPVDEISKLLWDDLQPLLPSQKQS